MKTNAAWFVVLSALLPGCKEQPVTERRPQGLLPGEEQAHAPITPPVIKAVTPPQPRQQPSALQSPFANVKDPGALSRPAATLPATMPDASVPDAPAPAAEPSAATVATTPRDLTSELITMLGRPAECLDLAQVASAGGRTTISITVSVMPSGRIIRASATAPNQTGEAITCLENKANAGTFRSPVPGAPRDVTATIPIEVVAQPQ